MRGMASKPSIARISSEVRTPAEQEIVTGSVRSGHCTEELIIEGKSPDYNETVSKAKNVEERLERIEQQLRLFQRVSRFMVREMSLHEVLQGIVSLVVEFTQCDSCLVYLSDGDELVLCASNTHHEAEIGKVRLKLNEGITGWVARERRLVAISREAYKDPRFKTFGELPEDTYEAFLSAPVIARNRVVGVINVQHRVAHQHSGGEMEVLTTLGEQVGCALALARLSPETIESIRHAELVLSGGPPRPPSPVRAGI
jgi:uroporphyrinogen-III synthase